MLADHDSAEPTANPDVRLDDRMRAYRNVVIDYRIWADLNLGGDLSLLGDEGCRVNIQTGTALWDGLWL